jgi:hypothetical protein
MAHNNKYMLNPLTILNHAFRGYDMLIILQMDQLLALMVLLYCIYDGSQGLGYLKNQHELQNVKYYIELKTLYQIEGNYSLISLGVRVWVWGIEIGVIKGIIVVEINIE